MLPRWPVATDSVALVRNMLPRFLLMYWPVLLAKLANSMNSICGATSYIEATIKKDCRYTLCKYHEYLLTWESQSKLGTQTVLYCSVEYFRCLRLCT